MYKQALEMASNNALVNYGYGILLLGGGFYPRSRMWRKAQVSRAAPPTCIVGRVLRVDVKMSSVPRRDFNTIVST